MTRHESAGIVPGIRPYFELPEEGLNAIAEALACGQVTNHGPHLQEFEELLASYLGLNEIAAVSTGFDALLLALKAFGFPPGKAILPAYTYIATLNAVVHAGLEPIFCDIEPRSFTMDPGHLSSLLEEHADVRCVVPVNVYGVPCDLSAIRALCDRFQARLIYDNAHGFGTEVEGCRISREPDAQIFSLHATKTLPAIEGGIVAMRDPSLMATVRRLRNHGLAQTPRETYVGYNAKLDEVRAIVGKYSLQHFPETLERRRGYGRRLVKCFERFSGIFVAQHIPKNVDTNFQNLGVLCPNAARLGLNQVLELFVSRGVGVRSYFSPPLYKIGGFENLKPLPVTESIWQTLISFPIHSRMTTEVLEKIEGVIAETAGILQTLC